MTFSYRQELARKSVHLSSIWMPLALYWLPPPMPLVLFALGLAGMLAFETLRRTALPFGLWLKRLIGPMMRQSEIEGKWRLTGASYTMLAGVVCTLVFPVSAAIIGLAIMVVADTAASLVGKRYGRHRLLDKSWEGTLAFLVSALFTVWLCNSAFALNLNWMALVGAAVLGTVVELLSGKWRVDDNLSVSLAGCLAVSVLSF